MSLIIEATVKTPRIDFNSNSGLISISGISIPEDPQEFFMPLDDELDVYVNEPSENTCLEFKLEYFNTSSSKCILDVFKKIEGIHKEGNSTMIINWHYEEDDEDMLEAGEDYESIIDVPFKMIEMEE